MKQHREKKRKKKGKELERVESLKFLAYCHFVLGNDGYLALQLASKCCAFYVHLVLWVKNVFG
jgi:hypothetical protein